MSLFNQILNAIDDPNREASSSQLGSILDTVNQLSQTSSSSPAVVQSALGLVGKYVQSGLRQTRQQNGSETAEALIERYSGTQPNSEAVQSILSLPQVQQLKTDLETQTGLSLTTIESLLPVLVPLVLQLLQTGKNSQRPGDNTTLSHFLDSDQDGDTDLMDAVQMATRFLNR